METILYDLINELNDHQDELNVSYIDEDFGQLEALDGDMETYPLTFPAILVDVSSTSWDNENHRNQMGRATITVKLIIDCYDDTHSRSTTYERIKKRAQMHDNVVDIIHDFRPENGGGLIRNSSEFYTNGHGIKVYSDTYECQVSKEFKENIQYISLRH